jgi:hypothetical protein
MLQEEQFRLPRTPTGMAAMTNDFCLVCFFVRKSWIIVFIDNLRDLIKTLMSGVKI